MKLEEMQFSQKIIHCGMVKRVDKKIIIRTAKVLFHKGDCRVVLEVDQATGSTCLLGADRAT